MQSNGVRPEEALVGRCESPRSSGLRRRTCLTHICVAVLCLFLGFLGGGAAMFAVRQSSNADDGQLPPLPSCPPCNCSANGTGVRCNHDLLDGRFGQEVDTTETALGKTIHVRFYMSHSFHAKDGTVDVSLVPIESPFDMLARFSCTSVPVLLNESSCVISIDDECTRAANAKNYVAAMNYLWDGSDTLTVFEHLHIPVLGSKLYTWTEPRSREADSASRNARNYETTVGRIQL
eukprot:TRINITY_DN78149_c0_g1_i1.p1 TRINITY_DN78149_c0_g1~~TRINITY_DN78149_c0_g1_i1.p1  ORF type:complete len:234 (-),score=28.63 TRINITY_DN78149_c0_g1_i1:175-876(-)